MNMLDLPKKVYFKSGSMNVALKELSEVYHFRRALLVSTPRLFRSGKVTEVDNWLLDRGIRTAEFFSISGPAPTFAELRSALPKLLEFEPDVLIGIGGGAAMSAAKALWALYEDPALDLAAAVKDPSLLPAGVKAKLVLVATSFGSGAQTSPYAVLRDDGGALCALSGIQLLPEISVTDARFAEGLSPEQINTCSLATLRLAVRAFADPGCNEYTQGLLREAVSLILRYLADAQAGCPVALEKLHNAGAIAGAAYGNVLAAPPLDDTMPDAGHPRVAELARDLGLSPQDLLAACGP